MKNEGQLWQAAAGFAARAHLNQMRKDERTPYFAHPVRVAMTIRDVFGCEDEAAICAGFLHDTIEDTTTDYDDLEGRFGATIADIVAAMTKNMMLPEKERERDYDARLAAGDWRARLVKLADVYDNWCDSQELSPESRKKLVGKAKRALDLAEGDRKHHPEMERGVRALTALTKGKKPGRA
jgi:guanosine-3',5'-bis(diphosphate) 3'-pyrophosphohydrolase